MAKFWSWLFGITMLACLLLFVVAPFVPGWWVPEGVSTHSKSVDDLFYYILYITGFFFILTEAILVGFMFRYGRQDDGTPPRPQPSVVANLLKPVTGVLNEPHKIELAWTIVPAAILLFIAFAQIGTWMDIKYQSRYPAMVGDKIPVVAEVSARQFEWRMRYPSYKRMSIFLSGNKLSKDEQRDFDTFGKYPQFDDVHVVNEIHAIAGYPSLVHLSTRDVIHSFNMPHFRIKQDALPGKVIPVWFIPKEKKSNTKYNEKTKQWDQDPVWDIACAELCGWGHYRMVGRVFVHADKKSFLDWLKQADEAQNARQERVQAQ